MANLSTNWFGHARLYDAGQPRRPHRHNASSCHLFVKRVSNTCLRAAILLSAVMVLAGLPHVAFAQSRVHADFNGDGFSDLAVGVPSEDVVVELNFAGAVNVIYGTSGGLAAAGNQLFTQDSPDILDAAEELDQFGNALTAGDFNQDGFADLAVGIHFEDNSAGAVNVIYGTALGLAAAGNQFFTQDSPGIKGEAEENDQFGETLAAGDFNQDGFTDLAVGVNQDDVGGLENAGAVSVIYGTARGLAAARDQLLTQDTPGIRNVAEGNDFFGTTLTAADFNGDGFSDLAVGLAGETIAGLEEAGGVNIIYGAPAGLAAARNQFFTQDTEGIPGKLQQFDEFGLALTAGDFNGDGFADLGASEGVGSVEEGVGAVNIIYGSRRGLAPPSARRVPRSQLFTQNTKRIRNNEEAGDLFGDTLTAGDFNQDGVADLAVGAPFEDLRGVCDDGLNGDDGAVDIICDAGAVNVIYGTSRRGLAAAGNQFFTQNTQGIPDEAEEEKFEGIPEVQVSSADFFGSALTAGDFNQDGFTDLAVGVAGESVGNVFDAGAVNVIYGTPAGLAAVGSQFFTQDTLDILDAAETGDSFGRALIQSAFREF